MTSSWRWIDCWFLAGLIGRVGFTLREFCLRAIRKRITSKISFINFMLWFDFWESTSCDWRWRWRFLWDHRFHQRSHVTFQVFSASWTCWLNKTDLNVTSKRVLINHYWFSGRQFLYSRKITFVFILILKFGSSLRLFSTQTRPANE